MVLRYLGCALALSACLPHARAAALLPEDPALDRPVTAEAEGPIARVLAAVSQTAGIELSIDQHVDDWTAALHVRDVPLRHVLSALLEGSSLEWVKDREGAYRMTSPAVVPPLVTDRRLLEALLASCPGELRPPMGPVPPETRDAYAEPPMDRAYALLAPRQRNAIEDGEEIPFAQLPSPVRRLLRDHRRGAARRDLRPILDPRWMVPPERLALQVQTSGAWVLRTRKAWPVPPVAAVQPSASPASTASEWEAETTPIPYQPRPRSIPYWDSSRRALSSAALAVAREIGISVAIVRPYGPAAWPAKGDTPDAKLASLLDEWMRDDYVWQLREGVYRLCRVVPWTPPGGPALERVRRNLERLLPAGYGPFLAPDAPRYSSERLLWLRLWQSLTDAQRAPGPPIPVAQLSREQQELLLRARQSGQVGRFIGIAGQGLGSQLEQSAASLDFDSGVVPYTQALGCRCNLRLRAGQREVLAGPLYSQPPVLRLLPAGDSLMREKADLEVEEETLGAMAERLSEILHAPVVIQEPRAEVKLTGQLRQKPIRLLLHWVERRTGLQWRKRGRVYVLAEPIPVAKLFRDEGEALALLGAGIAAPAGSAQPPSLRGSMTAQDRAALEGGGVSFSELSPELQEAMRAQAEDWVRQSVRQLREEWQFAAGLGQARVRLVTSPNVGRFLSFEEPAGDRVRQQGLIVE